jgi:hypothetical protein
MPILGLFAKGSINWSVNYNAGNLRDIEDRRRDIAESKLWTIQKSVQCRVLFSECGWAGKI